MSQTWNVAVYKLVKLNYVEVRGGKYDAQVVAIDEIMLAPEDRVVWLSKVNNQGENDLVFVGKGLNVGMAIMERRRENERTNQD